MSLFPAFYWVRIWVVSKMFIKSKGSVNIKLIYQGKTGAVCKTQLFIFELFEDFFSRIFNVFINIEYGYMALAYIIHKFDGCIMAASGFKERIRLIQYIIRAINNCISFCYLFVKNFCSRIEFVFGNSEGAECTGIYKDFQSDTSPYRYLS